VTGPDITAAMIDALNASGIPYLLAGSFSSSYYGVPRSSKDADFVIHLAEGSISHLESHLPAGFKLDRQMQFEGVTSTYKNVVTVPGTAFTIELFRLSQDAHDQQRFQRRQRVEIAGHEVFLATAEDVIVTKLRWYRGKDLDDIRGVISVQGAKLDWAYIRHWCNQHGTWELLEGIRASIPEGT
jgi:hypothetical protein